MRKTSLLVVAMLAVLSGCGSDSKERPNVAAPVNNIQDQIQVKEDLTKEIRDIGKANTDKTNEIIDKNLDKTKR